MFSHFLLPGFLFAIDKMCRKTPQGVKNGNTP